MGGFKDHLKTFVPMILSPAKIEVKKISGNAVKCKELVGFFRAYIEIFKGDEMPEPKSMLEATSEANNLASLSEAKDLYTNMMEGVCGGDKPFINEHILEIEHLRIRDAALEVFDKKRKMGGEVLSSKFRKQLDNEMSDSLEKYKLNNESKNVFKTTRSPFTLVIMVVCCYILCQFASLFGFEKLSNIINIIMLGCMFLLSAWMYIKYSGEYSEFGEVIDQICVA